MSSADLLLPPAPKDCTIYAHEWSGATVLEFPHARQAAGFGWVPPPWFLPALIALALALTLILFGLSHGPAPEYVHAGVSFFLACVVFVGLFVGIHLVTLATRGGPDGVIRQIRVNVESLARIDGSGQRQVWPRRDIADVRCETYEEPGGHYLGVFVRGRHGDRELIYGRVGYHEPAGVRRAELEWLAAVLRQALQMRDEVPTVTLVQPPLPSDAITRPSATPIPLAAPPNDAFTPRLPPR